MRLAMGLKPAPDMFQEAMNCVSGDSPCARVCLDDILCAANGTCEDHLEKLRVVLDRLNENGFKVNVRKSAFATDSLECLGHFVTRDGIQPQPKKVDGSAPATLHAQPKAMHSSAAPAGEGVLIPPRAGHASHAACACALPQTSEWTCKAAALLRSFSAAQPL
jgi:hypothetical protein